MISALGKANQDVEVLVLTSDQRQSKVTHSGQWLTEKLKEDNNRQTIFTQGLFIIEHDAATNLWLHF